MSSESRRTSKGDVARRADDDWYVIVVARVPPNIDWQEFKDAVRTTGAKHIRQADVHTQSDGTRIASCSVKGRSSAERVYDQFESEGLAGYSIKVALMKGTGPHDKPVKGPADSPYRRRSIYPAQHKTQHMPASPSTSPEPAPSAPLYAYGYHVPLYDIRAPTSAAPPPANWPLSTATMPVGAIRPLQQWSTTTPLVRSDVSTAPVLPHLNRASTKNKSIIIENVPYNYQARDIRKLLAERFRLSCVCELVDNSTFRASFASVDDALVACRQLDRQVLRRRELRAYAEHSVDRGGQRSQFSSRARVFEPRPQAPEFLPTALPVRRSKPVNGPLCCDGSQNNTRKAPASCDSDDD